MTLNQLVTSSFKLRDISIWPIRKDYGFKTIRLMEVRFVVFKGMKSIMVLLRIRGSRVAPTKRTYRAILMISDMDIIDIIPKQKPPKGYAEVVDDRHGKYWIAKINREVNKAQIRCGCMDDYMTWQFYRAKIKALYGGNMKAYKRKTNWMPERNPKHVPGICKHIIYAINILGKKKLIT